MISAMTRTAGRDLAEGQRLTHTGSWSLNIATRQILHSSAEHTRMFGFDPERRLPSFEEFLQRVYPEDQEDILEAFQTLMRSGGDLELPAVSLNCLRGILLKIPSGTILRINAS